MRSFLGTPRQSEFLHGLGMLQLSQVVLGNPLQGPYLPLLVGVPLKKGPY